MESPSRAAAPIVLSALSLLLAAGVLGALGEGTGAPAPAPQGTGLADDPSLGKVAERDGMVFLRPVGAERWTFACEGAPIEPGDQVRASARGANAAALELKDGSRLVLGPGTIIEILAAASIRLAAGELEIRPAANARLSVEGPGGARQEVTAPRILVVREGKLAALEKDPPWLSGFKAKGGTEAMGSLLAKVDGRDTPLTLGYHKVSVDIRDQIARTVVEESFANHTDSVLEGVFYFPLPQDASISGFGMWIGNELVLADVVEKERAREIYEDILRQKRDPGLLEWTGGNIFKARVYPIPAQGEKRIQITYTQVLPKEGNLYRYDYALQSEMLRLTPLRRLEIVVTVASAEPIASVACPSHAARIRKADRSARVEFTAEEYTPSRDLEVVVETGPAGEVVVVPHLRGEDGYFMVLLSAEGESGRREVLRDTAPLDLLIVADTSGSLTEAQLNDQRLFVASLLESLSAKDRFDLLAFDVNSAWAFGKAVAADAESRSKALDFLQKRGALGWTDLEGALGEALGRARKDTQVIYVGDGIPSLGDADPAALAGRLKKLYRGEGSVHAVSVGSTYDLTVLRALSSLGGGSLHRIEGGKTPPEAAAGLLAEITAPGLRDLSLEWKGIRVARVYPEILPNLPSGRQALILGRYLPEGRDLKGTLFVRGSLRGKPFVKEVPVAFAGAEEGNSFIPRLWARMHLDHLLEQGSDPQVKEKIIALSEDYQIMTPYTSFLVLESDADRERYGVTKRFRMRGGEEFFAAGREGADHELARQQMLAARTWRLGLRREALRLYEGMGRDLWVSEAQLFKDRGLAKGYFSAGRGGGWNFDSLTLSNSVDSFQYPRSGVDLNGRDSPTEESELYFYSSDKKEQSIQLGLESREFAGADGMDAPGESEDHEAEGDRLAMSAASPVASRTSMPLQQVNVDGPVMMRGVERRKASGFAGEPLFRRFDGAGLRPSEAPSPFGGLFPVPGAAAKPFQGKWPVEIRGIIEKLDRRRAIAALEGGLHFTVESDSMDARGRTRPGERSQRLISKESWASIASSQPGEIPFLAWLSNGTRGSADLARLLGGRRKAQPGDAADFPAPFEPFGDLEAIHAGTTPSMEREGDQIILKLTSRRSRGSETQIIIDPKRSVVLRITRLQQGKKVSDQVFDGFVEVQGAFWPRSIEWKNGDGKTVRTVRITCEALPQEAFRDALEEELMVLADAILIEFPLPKVVEAKQHALDGKASLEDRWVLLNHVAGIQDWSRVKEHADAIEAMVKGKAGLDWIRLQVLKSSRRAEEAKELAFGIARRLAGKAAAGEYGLVHALVWGITGTIQDIELLEILDILRPVWERQDPRLLPMKDFEFSRLNPLDRLGRSGEAFALRKEMAAKYPDDAEIQIQYAQALVQRGEVDGAVGHLKDVLGKNGPWSDAEVSRLRERAAGFLYENSRYQAFLAETDSWMREGPRQVPGNVFNLYLTALVMLDREEEADQRIAAWLLEARGQDPTPDAQARLEAAIQHALGHGSGFWSDRIEEKFLPLLADTARALARSVTGSQFAGTILQDDRFQKTDVGIVLRRDLYRELAKEVASLSAEAILNFVRWTGGYAPTESDTPREEILRKILTRWETENDPEAQGHLAAAILGGGKAEVILDLRRREFARSDGDEARSPAAWALLQCILGRPWSLELESEAMGLAAKIGWGEGRKTFQAEAVHVLARWIDSARAQKLMEAIPDRNKKSRRELKPLEDEARKASMEGAVEAIRKLEAAGLEPEVVLVARIERLTLEARMGKDPARVAEDLKSLLLSIPPVDEDDSFDSLREIMARRALLILGNLATREKADPALVDGFRAFLEDSIAKKSARGEPRAELYRFLLCLDRPEDLERILAAWAQADGEAAGNRWRLPLGYVLAERGKLQEAVTVFEAVRAKDELGPGEYRALAGWYMALERKDKNREARIGEYQARDEWTIRNLLDQDVQKYNRSGPGIPEELNEEVFLRLTALWRKSNAPQNHLWILQQYYEATKDFRLLETLPEALIGQTRAKVYDVLQNLEQILSLVGDEATVDRMEKFIAERLGKLQDPVDCRALRLLEFLVERKAADQANGTGPHALAALAALKEAWKGEWAEGEPVLMARLLASVGGLAPELRDEPIRELKSLHDGARAGTGDRFWIAVHRAGFLWNNERWEEAILVLSAGIEERRDAASGLLAEEAAQQLSTLGSYFEGRREFAAAEKMWRGEMARPYNEARKRQMAIEIYASYERALRSDAGMALGKGAGLYGALRDELLEALARRSDENHSGNLCQRLFQVFQAAHEKKIDGPEGDLRSFAFDKLPGILSLYQYRSGQNVVNQCADAMLRILGPRETLSFLVVRAETEPAWLRRQGSDFWNNQNWRFNNIRVEAKDLGDLEPRVLAIYLKALRRDLTDRRQRNRTGYDRRTHEFWAAKAENFFQTAREILEQRADSEESVKYIAEYLFRGLGRKNEAIEPLLGLEKKGKLGQEGKWELAQYLQEAGRFAESIPLLAAMVETWPDVLQYRTHWMRAWHRTGNSLKLQETLQAAEEHFRGKQLWNEPVIAGLGAMAEMTGLFEKAVALYQEAIPLHRKAPRHQGNQGNQGVGDGTLSAYYGNLARAFAGLGRTKEAVDAAAGAIVSWGRRQDQRAGALSNLLDILRRAKDLDAYAEALEKECRELKVENPTVRKALGKVYVERKEWAKARRQLEAAVEGGPTDPETSRALIEAYEGSGDRVGAAARLLALARGKGHDLALFRELGDRLKALERPEEAERAWTNLVELSANESEGRALLAEVREKDGRFLEAAAQWREVARIRSREPVGWLGLARDLIAGGRGAEAREPLEHLLKQAWPGRFGDVHGEARKLLEK